MATLKGLPRAYNKDLQEDKVPLFDAVDTVKDCLAIATGVPTTMTIYGLQLLIPPLPVPSSLQAITKTRRKRIKTNYLGCNAQSAGRLVNTQSIEASVDSLCREIITLCRHAIYVTSHTIQHI